MFFHKETWSNPFCKGTDYSFFNDNLIFEFEETHKKKFDPSIPSFLFQLGGDAIMYTSIGAFGYSLSVSVGGFH